MRKTFIAFSCLFSFLFFTTAFMPLHVEEEYGKAGYYADSLQGRKTASGEKYDKNALTCAHKSLPFGTKVRVTRLDDKRSVVVRVNDRGPFTAGYVIDISRRAAEVIGLIADGVARVKVEALEDEETAPAQYNTGSSKSKVSLVKSKTTAKGVAPAQYSTGSDGATASEKITTDLFKVNIETSARKGFGVQVSTLYDADNVWPVIVKLQDEYPGRVLTSVERDEANNKTTYRVIVGAYTTRAAAEEAQRSLARKYKRCFVVALNEI